jgi:hypothetical protein
MEQNNLTHNYQKIASTTIIPDSLTPYLKNPYASKKDINRFGDFLNLQIKIQTTFCRNHGRKRRNYLEITKHFLILYFINYWIFMFKQMAFRQTMAAFRQTLQQLKSFQQQANLKSISKSIPWSSND